MGSDSESSSSEFVAVGSADDVAGIYNVENGEHYHDDEHTDDTQSLTASIRQHIVDGGLRYHAYHAGQYAFPNDEPEQRRDDLKHDLTLHLCDGNYFLAPIRDRLDEGGAEVLDLGESCTLREDHKMGR